MPDAVRASNTQHWLRATGNNNTHCTRRRLFSDACRSPSALCSARRMLLLAACSARRVLWLALLVASSCATTLDRSKTLICWRRVTVTPGKHHCRSRLCVRCQCRRKADRMLSETERRTKRTPHLQRPQNSFPWPPARGWPTTDHSRLPASHAD